MSTRSSSVVRTRPHPLRTIAKSWRTSAAKSRRSEVGSTSRLTSATVTTASASEARRMTMA